MNSAAVNVGVQICPLDSFQSFGYIYILQYVCVCIYIYIPEVELLDSMVDHLFYIF